MEIDIIIPVGPKQKSIARLTILSLVKFLNPKRIYVVSSLSTFSSIRLSSSERIKFLNENEILENLTLENIQKYFIKRVGDANRAPWYFQQFLKMSISKLDFISKDYLVWDADCVLLKKIDFYAVNHKVYVTKMNENHLPYFQLIEQLLDLSKQVDFSFISEHFLVNKEIMKEIIFKLNRDEAKDWFWNILDSISDENIVNSGFSEYETYGNYVVKYYPELFHFRNLETFRYGGKYCGMNPSKFDLLLLSFVYTSVSFESWTAKVFSKKELIKLVYSEWHRKKSFGE